MFCWLRLSSFRADICRPDRFPVPLSITGSGDGGAKTPQRRCEVKPLFAVATAFLVFGIILAGAHDLTPSATRSTREAIIIETPEVSYRALRLAFFAYGVRARLSTLSSASHG